MKEVFRHRELALVTLRRTLLEEAGIDCVVKNEEISTTEASIPPFWPALYVIQDDERAKAQEVIRVKMAELSEGVDEEVSCPSCGEPNPGNFDICWSCGAELKSTS